MLCAVLVFALSACADRTNTPRQIAGADPQHGLEVIERVGCAACHTVPGVGWPRGRAGPTLEGFGSTTLIAGRLPNQPDVLIQWLIDAPSLSPETGMPAMPITDAEARDIAAYLYQLRD